MAAITSMVIAGASAVYSGVQGRKASKAQKRANNAQRKINQMKNRQAERAFLRNFRQAQAGALASSVFQGIGLESSGVQGQVQGLKAQAGSALRDFNVMEGLGGEMTSQMNKASKYGYQSQLGSSISSVAMSFASFSAKSSAVSTTSDPRLNVAQPFSNTTTPSIFNTVPRP